MEQILAIVKAGFNYDTIQVVQCFPYELRDYWLASRHTWNLSEYKEAISYAKELAEKHGLKYEPFDEKDEQEGHYLD